MPTKISIPTTLSCSILNGTPNRTIVRGARMTGWETLAAIAEANGRSVNDIAIPTSVCICEDHIVVNTHAVLV